MITYNDLYDALRKEKYSEQLQPLQKNFIKEVMEYLEDKKDVSEKKEDLFSDPILKTKKQFENAISIFKEILLRRKKKILNLSFIAKETGVSKRDFDNMLEFEKDIFDKVVKSMEDADKKISCLMNGSEKETHIMVTFKEKVDEFLDASAEAVGPFDKGEIANLPEEIVKILKDSGKVELVEG